MSVVFIRFQYKVNVYRLFRLIVGNYHKTINVFIKILIYQYKLCVAQGIKIVFSFSVLYVISSAVLRGKIFSLFMALSVSCNFITNIFKILPIPSVLILQNSSVYILFHIVSHKVRYFLKIRFRPFVLILQLVQFYRCNHNITSFG